MNDILIAIVWWFVWWLMSLILHYYNLKKESFFRLQEKWELLLTSIYKYQHNLCQIDLKNIDTDGEDVKTKDELEEYLWKSNDLNNFLSQHQKLRDKIWSLIILYFPTLKNDFIVYTKIEIYHKPDNEYDISTMNQREEKLSEIGTKVYNLIDKSRKVFFWVKI